MENNNKLSFKDYQDAIDDVCRRRASDYALSCLMNNGRRLNVRYSRLSFLINSFAESKKKYDLHDGDRVLVLVPVVADAFLTFEVLAANHLTVVLADAGVPQTELLDLIRSTNVRAIFTDKKRFNLVKEIHDIPIFLSYGLKNDMELLQAASKKSSPSEPTPDTLAIIFSSGTTAKMKPVEISYDAMLMSAARNLDVMDINERRSKMMFMMVFPVNHISGLACAAGMMLKGLSIATVETASSATLVGAIKMFEPVEFGMVPKVLAMFIEKMEEELKNRHIYGLYKTLRRLSSFSRIRLNNRAIGRFVMAPFRKALFGKNMYVVLSGGAPCIPEVTSAMLDLGLDFVVNYSSTECGVPIMQTDKSINNCFDSVGKADCDPNVTIKINDPDSSGVGEIYVKSRYMMKGYYNEPALTEAAFDSEWFKTGDNGFIDDAGLLHVVGRCKDSILLSSGKKVSPDDLENMLLPIIGLDISFSVVGVPDSEAGCDGIHIFIAGDLDDKQSTELTEKIGAWQRSEAKLYPISGIHFLKELPKTSIGKVKRVKLRELVMSERSAAPSQNVIVSEQNKDNSADNSNILEKVNEIVMRRASLDEPLTGYEDLIHDLGIDSLTMMEICTEIESLYGVFIGTYLSVLPNTIEIAEYIQDPIFISKAVKQSESAKKFDAFEFPKPRKAIHRFMFELIGNWFKKRLEFEVHGLEKLRENESYIFCPNHQTHVDGLWVWHALSDKRPPLDYIGCMAKMEHLDTALSRFMLTVLGGIPVDRSGNTMDSFKRSIEFIREGNSFLIHPEGTRTRNGKLGKFKSGAALMAIESGAKLVPVAIDGGLDVWSYDMKRPKTNDPVTKKKRRITITFCDPIAPIPGREEQMTEQMYNDVLKTLSGGSDSSVSA